MVADPPNPPAEGATRVLAPFTHRALKLQPPQPREQPPTPAIGEIQRRDRLGGLIHEYYRTAA
jgi:hypothetical protein